VGTGVPHDLGSVYQARYEPYDPYLIICAVLWERYKMNWQEKPKGKTRITLTTFQNDGIFPRSKNTPMNTTACSSPTAVV